MGVVMKSGILHLHSGFRSFKLSTWHDVSHTARTQWLQLLLFKMTGIYRHISNLPITRKTTKLYSRERAFLKKNDLTPLNFLYPWWWCLVTNSCDPMYCNPPGSWDFSWSKCFRLELDIEVEFAKAHACFLFFAKYFWQRSPGHFHTGPR